MAARGTLQAALTLLLASFLLAPVAGGADRLTFRRVWADSKTNALGAPSPDGRYLSFVDWETGDLAVRDLATGENHRLTNKGSWKDSAEYAYFSIFSPDSRQVAYAWFNEKKFYELRVVTIEDFRPPLLAPLAGPPTGGASDEPLTRPPIGLPYRAGLRGSPPRLLYRNEEVQFIKPTMWSADGQYILALVFGRKILNQIVLFSAADGAMRVLKSPFWIYPKMMGLSPDGRWVVYSLNQDPPHLQHDIYLLATDGSRDIPLVEHPANDIFPLFTPDGKHVLFLSNRLGTLDAWLLPVDGDKPAGPPALLKKDMGRFLPLGFTQKGAFYYAVRTGNEDAWTATLDPEAGRVLEAPQPVSQLLAGLNRSPDWSPDGRQLAFLSRVDTENHGLEMRVVTIQSRETGKERQFGVPKLGYLDWLRWSPDGRSLLVGGADTANNFGGLYQIDIDSERVATIVQHEYAPPRGFEGIWAVGGDAVIYVHEDMRENATSLRRRSLASGEERTLHQAAPFWRHNNLALSPDGQLLAFGLSDGNRTEAKVLMLMPAGGGESRELLRLKRAEMSGFAFTRDGRHLLFSRAGKPTPQMWRISIDGGAPRNLGLATNLNARISPHPDGRQIAYTAGETRLEVWVMDNILPELRARR